MEWTPRTDVQQIDIVKADGRSEAAREVAVDQQGEGRGVPWNKVVESAEHSEAEQAVVDAHAHVDQRREDGGLHAELGAAEHVYRAGEDGQVGVTALDGECRGEGRGWRNDIKNKMINGHAILNPAQECTLDNRKSKVLWTGSSFNYQRK